MRVVDVHAHAIPPDLVARVRNGEIPGVRIEQQGSGPWVVHEQGYRYALEPAFHDTATRLQAMDEAGIAESVLSVAPPFLQYDAEPETAVRSARMVNDALATMAAQAPERLSAVATLPMQSPDDAVAELERAVTELGLRGAQVGSHVEGTPLDAELFAPVLRAAQRLHVPLIMHPYYVGSAAGLEEFYLTNLEGNPWQTAVAAARLILSGSLDRLPELDLLLVHGGGHLLYQIGRLDHGHRVRAEATGAAEAPSAYLRRFHYDTLTHRPASTAWLADQVGADRVAYGTDVPFDMAGGTLEQQLGDMTTYPQASIEAIAHETADLLFGLEGTSR